MDRKLRIFIAALALNITLSPILITAQKRGAPPSAKLVQPANEAQNRQAIAAEQTERDIRALTDELKALRNEQAQAERERTAEKKQNGPPIWSNWVLVFVAGFAG